VQRSLVEKEVAAAKLAGRSAWPDLTIGIEYIDTDEARFPDVPGSGNNATIAKASLSVPLGLGRHRAEKAEAQARKSAAEGDLTQLHNRLLADLERMHFEFRDAERRVVLYADTLLPRARQSLATTENAFVTGEVAFLDLIDSQRTLLEIELAYLRAQADRATHRAHLEMLVGCDLATQ
jgi:outer membrane protein TolC